MARPRKKLDARLLRKVEKWLLKEEKPLSFVLGELKLTVKQWEVVVESSAAWALVASIRLVTRRLARHCQKT